MQEVPSVVLASLVRFYDDDVYLTRASQLKAERVWGSGWCIPWGAHGSGGTPWLFNNPTFQALTQRFVVRAIEHLNVARGFAFTYKRNLGAWLLKFTRARTTQERDKVGLPFRLLEPVEYVLQRKRDAPYLTARPVGASAKKGGAAGKRDIAVYDDGVQLLTLSESDYGDAYTNYQNVVGTLAPGVAAESAWVPGETCRPRSPIYALMDLKSRLNAARTNLAHADLNLAHPRPLLTSELPDTHQIRAGDLPDPGLFSDGSVSMAAMQHAIQNERASFVQHLKDFEAIMRQHNPDAPRMGEATLTTQLRRYYQVPDPIEDAHMFGPSIRVAAMPLASVLTNESLLEARLVDEVAAVTGVPASLLSKQRIGSGGSGGSTLTGERSQEMHTMHQLDMTVAHERRTAAAIWRYVYTVVFGGYNMERLNDQLAMYTASATAEGDVVAEGEAAEIDTDAADAERGRLTMDTLRGLLGELEAGERGIGPPATTLMFGAEPTVRATEKNMFTLQLFDRGLVSWEETQRVVREVYEDLTLQEPPPLPDAVPVNPDKPKKVKEPKKPPPVKARMMETTPVSDLLLQNK